MSFVKKIEDFLEKNNNLKTYLLLANIFLIFFSIACSNLNCLPLKHFGDFGFLIFIVFLFALYRPGWTFLFFIGFILIETINLAPRDIGIMLRPYQVLGALGAVAVLIRFLSNRLNFNLPKIVWQDWALIIFSISGFISSFFAENKGLSFKQSLVIFSFLILYFFTRVFIQNTKDIKRVLTFFISSSFVVVLYSVWQNWRFLADKSNFEAMPGRPNGTFTEADWLGMFMVFLISVLYVIAYDFYKKINFDEIKYQTSEFIGAAFSWIMISLSYIVLIIAVSRSAWLGAGAVLAVFTLYILRDKNYSILRLILGSLLLSLGVVYIFSLTNFELGNRIQSTGTGKQEITVSCDEGSSVPRSIVEFSELREFNCIHINLEDIEKEKSTGRIITRAYRDDPNVSIRSEIYKKSWEEIKENPLLGIGWGSISNVLGNDDRGAGLNSSNIFLEVWLGAGIIGLISFVLIIGSILYKGVRSKGDWGIFLVLSSVAIIIPNLFNAGIMLGFIWVWLAITQIEE